MNTITLIQELEKAKKEGAKIVSFDSEANISHLCSWRGIYSEPCLIWTNEGGITDMDEVIELLETLEGSVFTGWKGGEFIMSEYDSLWIEPTESSYNSMQIIDISIDESCAYLNLEEQK